MKIVSGKTGSPHVTSHEFRQIIEGTIGQESYILKSSDNLEPELVSNNLLKIKSGMMSHHGNVSSVENYDEIELTNGTQGMKRIDLIVNRYTRNDETKIENNSWVCIVGTPDASSPTVPAYTVGNIQDGDLIDDCPYLEVHYDGINVTEVKKLLSVAKTASEMEAELTELNRKFVFKRQSSSEAGMCTPHYIMIMGTRVLQGTNADYRLLFSASDLLSKLKFYDPSISNFDEEKCVITTNNGDGNAAAIHFYAPEWWGSNNAYYQYFYPDTSAQIRVNYCIHYLKL